MNLSGAVMEAIFNNGAAILTAFGGMVITLMNGYIMFQNWRAKRFHDESRERIEAVAQAVGAAPAPCKGNDQ